MTTGISDYGSDPLVRIYYCVNPSVGTGHTFTISSSNIYAVFAVIGFSTAADAAVDVSSGYSQGSASTINPGSITPSGDGRALISFVATQRPNGTTYSIDGGFTETAENSPADGAYYGGEIAYLIQTTAAAANPTITASTSVLASSAILVAWSPMRSMFLAQNSRCVQGVMLRGSSIM